MKLLAALIIAATSSLAQEVNQGPGYATVMKEVPGLINIGPAPSQAPVTNQASITNQPPITNQTPVAIEQPVQPQAEQAPPQQTEQTSPPIQLSSSVSREKLTQNALENASKEIAESTLVIKTLETELDKAQSPEKRRQDMQNELNRELKGTGAEVYRNRELIVVRVKDSVFKSGSEKTSPDVKRVLAPIAKAALKNAADFDIMIEGHTDSTPLRTNAKFANNWQMGFARAEEVALQLQSMLLRNTGIAIASRGNNLSTSKDPKAASNRRVEFVFMPKREATGTAKDAYVPPAEPIIAQQSPPVPEPTPMSTPEPTPVTTPTPVPAPIATPTPEPTPIATPNPVATPTPSKPSKMHNGKSATIKKHKEVKSLDPEGDAIFDGKK